jgi:hypothetical protein
VEPVLDVVRLFHMHDNLGARLAGEGGPSIDPLQLDLHLPPGSGTIPWVQLWPALGEHDAPLMMEIHPAHRPGPSSLREAAVMAFGQGGARIAPRALQRPAPSGGAGSASVPGARGLSRARHSASS